MMGSHQMVEKSIMYEEAVRIPWLMRIPQLHGGRQLVKQPVSQIDMVPTLLVFNLRKDPGETTNLFGSDPYRDVITRLTRKIHQWQESVADDTKL